MSTQNRKQVLGNGIVLLHVIVIFALLASCRPGGAESIADDTGSKSPNFIFVLVDDQGWTGTSVQMMDSDSLSMSDYHSTPNLEKLAFNGRRFSHAYSAAPVCAPSRYSIQFAKSPARLSLIRVGMNTEHIDHHGFTSIPKALKQVNANYQAAHFGKWGMGSTPEVFGYDLSDGPTQNKEGGFVNDRSQWDHTTHEDPKQIFSLTKSATNFMEESVSRDQPFYLQVSHYAVHSSVQSRAESLGDYDAKPPGTYQKNQGFAAMTQDLDSGLGIILDKVHDLGIEDNTYIFYMSDNGSVPNIPGAVKYTHSYNYPLSRGKWDAMEGGVRVPLIISGPGIASGSESTVPVSGSDMMPTLLELCGGDPSDLLEVDGGSFTNALFAENNEEVLRSVDGIFFHVPYRNGIALKRPHSGVRQGDYKLVKFQDNGELLLYNVVEDKGENRNLLDNQPERAQAMEEALDSYLSDVKAPKWQEGITWKMTPLHEIGSHH